MTMVQKIQDLITIFLFGKVTFCSQDLSTNFASRKKNYDLVETDHEPLSEDPDEAKLDYWREDSLFHAFHALLHRIWDRLENDTSSDHFERPYELFFYAHSQMVRRYGKITWK